MRYLIFYIVALVFLSSCDNGQTNLTSNTNIADVHSGLLADLVADGGFDPVLTGEQKGNDKDGLVYVTVEFKTGESNTVVEEFNTEHIKATNGKISDLKKIGFGKYQFILKPILPEKVTVVIPEGGVSHSIFNFKNTKSNELSYEFQDPEYNELVKNGLTVVLSSKKRDGVMEIEVNFNAQVDALNESDLILNNGAITKITKISNTKWLVDVTALADKEVEAGAAVATEVTAYIPEGVVESKFYDFKNKVSNTVNESFLDTELDKTIKVETLEITKVESYAPAKLVLIIDDSSSMAVIQEKVANSLRDALVGLKGKNIRVYAYSTSAIASGKGNFGKEYRPQMPYGQSVFHNRTGMLPSVRNGLKTGGNYLNEYMGFKARTASVYPYLYKEVFVKKNGSDPEEFQEGMFYNHDEVIETFSINKSAFTSDDGSVFIGADLSEDDFDVALEEIYGTIKGFGTKGNTFETPICTLLTILKNEGPHAIFKNREKTTFLIVTDEANAFMPCLSGYHAKEEVMEGVRVVAINHYKYLAYDFNRPCDTGSSKVCIQNDRYRIRKDPPDNTVEQACYVGGVNHCENTTDTCNADDIAAIRSDFKVSSTQWLSEDDSELKCLKRIGYAESTNPTAFGSKEQTVRGDNILPRLESKCDEIVNFEFKDENGNWIRNTTQSLFGFLKERNTLANQPFGFDLAYHNNRCGYIAQNTKTTLLGEDGGNRWRPGNELPDGHLDGFTYINGLVTIDKMKEAVNTEAEELLGKSNYTIVAIANRGEENPAGCTDSVDARSSDVIDISQKQISICDDDYRDAFAWFEEFVRFVAQPTYDLKSQGFEEEVKSLLSVKLSYQDNSLDKSEYSFVNGVLTFKDPDILSFIGGETFEIKYRNFVE